MVGLYLLNSTRASSTINTTKIKMITPPITRPTISPAPTVLPSLTDSEPLLGVKAVEVVVSGRAVPIGQSEALMLSSVVAQVGSRWSLKDSTMMEARPPAIQDCMRATSAGPLYTSVPAILPL